MMSAAVKKALQSVQTRGALISLFTLSHSGMTTLYYTDNPLDLTYDGQLYTACPSVFDWPSESSGSVSSAALTVYNDPALMAALRNTAEFVAVDVKVIWYDAGAMELVKSASFVITNFDFDDAVIQATVAVDDALDYEVLPIELTPQVAPGLFA